MTISKRRTELTVSRLAGVSRVIVGDTEWVWPLARAVWHCDRSGPRREPLPGRASSIKRRRGVATPRAAFGAEFATAAVGASGSRRRSTVSVGARACSTGPTVSGASASD